MHKMSYTIHAIIIACGTACGIRVTGDLAAKGLTLSLPRMSTFVAFVSLFAVLIRTQRNVRHSGRRCLAASSRLCRVLESDRQACSVTAHCRSCSRRNGLFASVTITIESSTTNAITTLYRMNLSGLKVEVRHLYSATNRKVQLCVIDRADVQYRP